MNRIDQDFISDFSKNLDYENFLRKLNNTLSRHSTSPFEGVNLEENYCNIYIIGVPRSGTTLVNQYLTSALDVGYINNLIASFWKVPHQGAILSKKLLGTEYLSNFSSNFGRTSDIKEPHEFGYFWSERLNFRELIEPTQEKRDRINLKELRDEIIRINLAFDKPVVYKSIFLSWWASEVVRLMPKTIFVHVTRDWKDNADSLLRIRKKYFNDLNTWASFKPKQFEQLKNLNPVEQVVGQVYYLNQSFTDELSKIGKDNKITIRYEDFVENPIKLLDDIIFRANRLNGVISKSSQKVPKRFMYHKNDIEESLVKAYKAARHLFDNR